MKNECLIVVCMMLSAVCGCIVPEERYLALNSDEETPPENIRDALKRQLEYDLSYWSHSGVVTCAENEGQALKLFETHMVPTLGDRSENRIKRLRNRIIEGRAWIYQIVSDDWHQCYLLDLAPCSSESLGYGFHYIVSSRNRITGVVNPPIEHHLMLRLYPKIDDPLDQRRLSAYEEYCQRLPRLRDAIPRHGDVCPYDPDSPDATLAIVDVTDVELVRVEGFDVQRYHAYSLAGESCRGIYRVRLDVREVIRGELSSEIYVLETSWPWDLFKFEGGWIFYRGMTLRMSVHRDKDDLLLVEALPVEPYPPYSNVTKISGGSLVGGFLADGDEGRLETLIIEYGTHTKVEFRHGNLITSGRKASFADFGVTSKFKVLELKEGANMSYWKDAWFIRTEKDYDLLSCDNANVNCN